MRHAVEQSQLKRILIWTHRVLLTLAAPLIVYCLLVTLESWLFQQRAKVTLSRQVETLSEGAKEVRPAPPDTKSPGVTAPPAPDAVIGRIDIDRLELSAIIAEGTSTATLRHAVGHITGTGLPGQTRGNIGLAALRDTFFRPLKDVRISDLIVITTPGGAHRYRVVSTKVVAPEEVSVLEPAGDEVLTLVTCFPFHFVGSAPKRFIVRAQKTHDM
jgi:sortase A